MILLGFVCFGAWAVVMSAALAVGTEQAVESLRRRPISVGIGGVTIHEYASRVKVCEREASTPSRRKVEELEACMARAGR